MDSFPLDNRGENGTSTALNSALARVGIVISPCPCGYLSFGLSHDTKPVNRVLITIPPGSFTCSSAVVVLAGRTALALSRRVAGAAFMIRWGLENSIEALHRQVRAKELLN